MNEMKGSGCKNCPVNPCETMNYRGSTCSAQRARFGLGDPATNADIMRSMTDKELAAFLARHDTEQARLRMETQGFAPTATQIAVLNESCYRTWIVWLGETPTYTGG